MKDYEQQLEERLDRELKELPELQAPPALAARILSAVSRRAARPWYRRSWQAWPVTLQAASLPILLAMFGGLCWSVSALAHTVAAAPATQRIVGRNRRTAGDLADAQRAWRRGGPLLPPSRPRIPRRRFHSASSGIRRLRGPRHTLLASRYGAI